MSVTFEYLIEVCPICGRHECEHESEKVRVDLAEVVAEVVNGFAPSVKLSPFAGGMALADVASRQAQRERWRRSNGA